MNKRLLIWIVCFASSFIITVQFRTIHNQRKQAKSIEVRLNDMVLELEKEKIITEYLHERINYNLKEKENYFKECELGDLQQRLKRCWKLANEEAGLTDVFGSGIIIKLSDANLKLDYKNIDAKTSYLYDARNFIVHDMDIVRILNELKIYGSYAISINDERIIPTSEQICVGTTVRINKRRIAAPYVIKALGDSNRLFDGMKNSSYVKALMNNKLEIEIRKVNEISIPKYRYDIKKLVTGLEVSKR